MKKTRVAVLVSGNGSNLQALVDACASPDFPAEIVVVISNKDDAYGLTRAKDAGIATAIIRHKDYASRETFDDALHAALTKHDVQFVCLAGFMRVLTAGFVEKWEGKMINIHPSLLPLFKGVKTHEAALAAGVKIHGCSVHWVVPEMDSGALIVQAAVIVHSDDTVDSLAKRVLTVEHVIYPLALAKVLSPHSVRPLTDAQKDALLISY